jgi:hypothetical protein
MNEYHADGHLKTFDKVDGCGDGSDGIKINKEKLYFLKLFSRFWTS